MPASKKRRKRARSKNKYCVIIFQDGSIPHGNLNRPLFDRLNRLLDEVVTGDPASCEIDIWLASFGGDAHIAYRLVLALRARCRWLRVVIPDSAKSAATFIALGCDEIYMDAGSELGPLDVQFDHPDREGYPLSGLIIANSMKFWADSAAEYLVSSEKHFDKLTETMPEDMEGMFVGYAGNLFRPLIGKLDPFIIPRVASELELGVRYASELLEGRACDVPEDFNPLEVAKHFVYSYPSHDYAISRSQATELGLPVMDIEAYRNCNKVKKAYHRWMDAQGEDGNRTLLVLVPME